jgi:hypothetical protein
MTEQQQVSPAGIFGAIWGAGGLSVVLLDAINRLSGIAMEAFDDGLSGVQWSVLVIVVVAMAYMEGYRGFQKSFSPRCAARTFYLYRNPDLLSVVLAPFFIMGFFRATRAPFLFAWVGTALIVLLVIALQISPQPWRGIVDCGVVVGLSWGLASFLAILLRVFQTGEPTVSAAIPE